MAGALFPAEIHNIASHDIDLDERPANAIRARDTEQAEPVLEDPAPYHIDGHDDPYISAIHRLELGRRRIQGAVQDARFLQALSAKFASELQGADDIAAKLREIAAKLEAAA